MNRKGTSAIVIILAFIGFLVVLGFGIGLLELYFPKVFNP